MARYAIANPALSIALSFCAVRVVFGAIRRGLAANSFLLLLIVLALIQTSYAQLPSNVFRRTLLIQAGSETATAFTIEVDGRQYLITAKHVLSNFDDASPALIKVRKNSAWLDTKVTVYKCADPVDIAVMIPPAQMTVAFPLEPDGKGLILGQEAYFMGFPYGLNHAQPYGSEVLGFIRKATVAQFVFLPELHTQQILLDGYNNVGLSGSPLVFRDQNASVNTFKVAGVVVSYESYISPVFSTEEIPQEQVTSAEREQNRVVKAADGKVYRLTETDQVVQLNTGITTAWGINLAVELIRKHATGPKVSDNFTGE